MIYNPGVHFLHSPVVHWRPMAAGCYVPPPSQLIHNFSSSPSLLIIDWLTSMMNCHFVHAPDSHIDLAIMLWTSAHNIPLPDYISSWNAPIIDADKTSLWSSLTDSYNRARLLAFSSPHCGDWLHALPVASCGTRVDNAAIRVAVGPRIRVHLCEPHICP